MKDARMDRENNRIIRRGVKSVINPYDLSAFGEGLRIKELTRGSLTVMSMAIPEAETLLKELISMGADRAILLTDRAFAGADTLATSYTLSRGAAMLGPFDLILCGRQTTDGDTAQVGPAMASMMGIVHVANATKIDVCEGTLLVTHNVSAGMQRVKVNIPLLITCEKDINTPGFSHIDGIIRMRNTDVEIYRGKDIGADLNKVGLKGSATKVIGTFTPKSKTDALFFRGNPEKLANDLACVLGDLGIIDGGKISSE